MGYTLLIGQRAEKELAQLPVGSFDQVSEAIRRLAADPRPHRCARLAGRPGWRIRVGRFRVIYEIDDAARTVTVLHVGHRRDVYR